WPPWGPSRTGRGSPPCLARRSRGAGATCAWGRSRTGPRPRRPAARRAGRSSTPSSRSWTPFSRSSTPSSRPARQRRRLKHVDLVAQPEQHVGAVAVRPELVLRPAGHEGPVQGLVVEVRLELVLLPLALQVARVRALTALDEQHDRARVAHEGAVPVAADRWRRRRGREPARRLAREAAGRLTREAALCLAREPAGHLPGHACRH